MKSKAPCGQKNYSIIFTVRDIYDMPPRGKYLVVYLAIFNSPVLIHSLSQSNKQDVVTHVNYIQSLTYLDRKMNN